MGGGAKEVFIINKHIERANLNESNQHKNTQISGITYKNSEEQESNEHEKSIMKIESNAQNKLSENLNKSNQSQNKPSIDLQAHKNELQIRTKANIDLQTHANDDSSSNNSKESSQNERAQSQRVSRKNFLLSKIVICMSELLGVWFLLLSANTIPNTLQYIFCLEPELSLMGKVFENLFILLLAPLSLLFILFILFYSLKISIWRLYDLNQSAYWELLMNIPIINLFFGIYLFFVKGTEGDNRFGAEVINESDDEFIKRLFKLKASTEIWILFFLELLVIFALSWVRFST